MIKHKKQSRRKDSYECVIRNEKMNLPGDRFFGRRPGFQNKPVIRRLTAESQDSIFKSLLIIIKNL
jgi:hypothetical protein